MKHIKKAIAIGAVALTALTLVGCNETQADKASENLSIAADNFEVQRSIVGINGITGETIFLVEGRCSLTRDGDLVVTCKHGEDENGEADLRKHYLGLSDNVTYVSTQLEGIDVSTYHTRIILKPQTIIPEFDIDLTSDLGK